MGQNTTFSFLFRFFEYIPSKKAPRAPAPDKQIEKTSLFFGLNRVLDANRIEYGIDSIPCIVKCSIVNRFQQSNLIIFRRIYLCESNFVIILKLRLGIFHHL